MTQVYKKVIEIVGIIEIEEIEYPTESEVDELLGDLNPRYYEETLSMKDVQNKVFSSDINFSSGFNMFTPF